MTECYIRAQIVGELPSGQKVVRLLASGADGTQLVLEGKDLVSIETYRANFTDTHCPVINFDRCRAAERLLARELGTKLLEEGLISLEYMAASDRMHGGGIVEIHMKADVVRPKSKSGKTVKVPDGVYVQDEDGQGWHFLEEGKR